MSQVTLQDCIDELEKIKKIAISEECGVDPKRITKVQKMIVGVGEAILNNSCANKYADDSPFWKE